MLDTDDEDDDGYSSEASHSSFRCGRVAQSPAASLFDRDDTTTFSRADPASPAPSAGGFEAAVRSAAMRLRAQRMEEDSECQRIEEGDNRARRGCWGCHYGATRHRGQAHTQPVEALVCLIRNNHGRMDNVELARLVHEHHEAEIRQPALSAGAQCSEWSVRSILQHLRHHTLDPGIVTAENIRTLRGLVRALSKRSMETDPETGAEKIDTRNVDLLLKTVKGLNELYARRPETMLFGSTADSNYVVSNPSTK